MDLFYKRSVKLYKKQGENRWKEPIFGEPLILRNIEIHSRPLFKTVKGKREIEKQLLLIVYSSENFSLNDFEQNLMNAKVVLENQDSYCIYKETPEKNEQGIIIKYWLYLREWRNND